MNKKPIIDKNTEIITGEYDKYQDWIMDPKGYFLIRVNREEKLIELGFCKKDNKIEVVIKGKIPQEIYMTAMKKKLLSRMEHAAYLGEELEKAYLALKYNLDYVQDSELDIN